MAGSDLLAEGIYFLRSLSCLRLNPALPDFQQPLMAHPGHQKVITALHIFIKTPTAPVEQGGLKSFKLLTLSTDL